MSQQRKHSIAFLLLIGLLWYWQRRTQSSLKSEMRRAWHHLSDKGRRPEGIDKIGGFRKGLAMFLDSRLHGNGELEPSVGSRIARWLCIVSEALAVFVIFLAIARIGLFAVDSSGGLCEPDLKPSVRSKWGPVQGGTSVR